MTKKLSYVCYGLAGVLLAGALGYYNFIDKKKPGAEVGDKALDFTVSTMSVEGDTYQMSGKNYNLYANNGKVRVVNFWATYCEPCKHEMPEFDKFAKRYSNVDVIVICGASGPDDVVVDWMNDPKYDAKKNGWADYSCTFALDTEGQDAYNALGALLFPTTVVIDEDGVVRYTAGKTLNFEKLEEIVLPLLND